MKVTDIAFTGYPVTNMKRAKEFYEGFLGLKKSRDFGQTNGEEQWVEYDIGSSCLALISSAPDQWPPAKVGSPAIALEVDDLDAYRDAAKKKNLKEVFPYADTPMCRLAVIADPDGNWIALHQRKAKA